jgi:predicted transcriptional regulator of viral defense system
MRNVDSAELRGLSTQERAIVSVLDADERRTVTVDDVINVHACSRPVAHQILSRLHRKGWLRRIKRGVYTLVPLSSRTNAPAMEDSWAIAMTLFRPAFISGWSAAEHWDLTEQVFNAVAVVTTQRQRSREQVVGGVRFILRTLPTKRFFGARRVWSGSTSVQVADPSRMLIDILDAPRFGGGGRHTLDVAMAYWRSPHKDPDRLLDYAIRFGRGSVFKRLGFTAEESGADVPRAWLEQCRARISKGIADLDPDVTSKGPVSQGWRLRINIPVVAS